MKFYGKEWNSARENSVKNVILWRIKFYVEKFEFYEEDCNAVEKNEIL